MGQSVATDRPRLLDLFCGAGGAAMGWAMAGFEVIGVDLESQPNYPFEFHQADALDELEAPEWPVTFDVIHASPPCQRYANVTRWRGNPEDHPDLLDLTLEALRARGTPWVVENVPEAIRNPDLMLCGSMFGLSVKRHRHFLASVPLTPPASCWHADRFAFMHKGEQSYAEAMNCWWMTSLEAREAIPPAYTKCIADQMIRALGMDVPPVGSRWARCDVCRKVFPTRRSHARYCTAKCRVKAGRRRQKSVTFQVRKRNGQPPSRGQSE